MPEDQAGQHRAAARRGDQAHPLVGLGQLALRLTAAAAVLLVATRAGAQAPSTSTPASTSTPTPTPTSTDASAPIVAPPPQPVSDPVAEEAPAGTGGFGFSVDLAASALTSPPALALTTPNGASMSQFGDGPIQPIGDTLMFDVAVNVFYRTHSPLLIPIVSVEFGAPVQTGYPGDVPLGPANAPLTWVKSSGTTYYDGFDVLGLGLELESGRFSGGLQVRPGLRYLRMVGTITKDLLTVDAEAHKYSFSLHADAQACVGVGTMTADRPGATPLRWCLFGGPHVYEFRSWLNGFVLGLRVSS